MFIMMHNPMKIFSQGCQPDFSALTDPVQLAHTELSHHVASLALACHVGSSRSAVSNKQTRGGANINWYHWKTLGIGHTLQSSLDP